MSKYLINYNILPKLQNVGFTNRKYKANKYIK